MYIKWLRMIPPYPPPKKTKEKKEEKKGKINKIRNMKYQKSTDELLPIRNIQIITAQTSKADYEQPPNTHHELL